MGLGKGNARPFVDEKTQLIFYEDCMNIETLRSFLLWCSIINYAILIVWFLVFTTAHDFVYRLHGKWFRLSIDRFDELNYEAMAIYKIGVLLLNVVPLIALWIAL